MLTLIEEKKLTIDVEPTGQWPFFFADPVRARDIIANVLSNAIKFSPVGGIITIQCELSEKMAILCIS